MDTLATWSAVLERLSQRAQDIDIAGRWPRKNIDDLAHCGALKWSVPIQYGGTGLSQIQLHMKQPGVRIISPAPIAVLNAGNTVAINLRGVAIKPEDVLVPCSSHNYGLIGLKPARCKESAARTGFVNPS